MTKILDLRKKPCKQEKITKSDSQAIKGKKRRRNNKNADEDLFMFHVMICEYLSHVNHVSHDLFRKPV